MKVKEKEKGSMDILSLFSFYTSGVLSLALEVSMNEHDFDQKGEERILGVSPSLPFFASESVCNVESHQYHICLQDFKYVMKEFLTYRNPGPLFLLPKGKMFGHPPYAPIVLPSWLSENDVNY
ncbi:PREDICTED: bifunctional epoxide hydrolase 2 [Prunus dulcis]|uniref:PREDICTED: bifunctional epoxide hydrolase 2 n=1 Tax=Prunus dulcis TaxID=3755 RepID=A0A5E4GI28_PRUDU|nr:PREDICTED: bifunctional epoxide hydrolase 2 [Prunus dulcis]